MEKRKFGTFLTERRKAMGLTQKEFAARLHVTESAVSKWERSVSFPDITLIEPICQTLQITEHEMITASEDYEQHRLERDAASHRRFVRLRLWSWSLGYAAALLATAIPDLALHHRFTWFPIVLTALMIGFSITNLPLLLKRRRASLTLAAGTGSLLLLLAAAGAYTGGGWLVAAVLSVLLGLCVVFLPPLLRGMELPRPLDGCRTLFCLAVDTVLLLAVVLFGARYAGAGGLGAMPYTALLLICPWAIVLFCRYVPVNRWFKTAFGLAVGTVTMVFADVTNEMFSRTGALWPIRLEPGDLTAWTGDVAGLVAAASMAAAAVICLGLGIVRAVRRRRGPC